MVPITVPNIHSARLRSAQTTSSRWFILKKMEKIALWPISVAIPLAMFSSYFVSVFR